jgi:RNA polymerase sigma-70 factor (ECF subfamily)
MHEFPRLDRSTIATMNDASLVEAFQRGGQLDAFEEVFRRNKDLLYRFLLRLAGSEAIAQDISQQAWLKILELAREGRYRRDVKASFRTFLFTLARNRYFDEYRRRHEATHSESLHEYLERDGDPSGDSLLDPSRIVSDANVRAKIEAAVLGLPTEQHEVISLWLQGFSLTEVAQITGAPWHTVVSRKSYAMKKLKIALLASGLEANPWTISP